jgi:hypothetical protein
VKIEQLTRAHVETLAAQGVEEAQEALAYIQKTIDGGPAFAGLVDEGVAACVGLYPINEYTYRCWALTDPKLASRHFLSLNKAMRAWFIESRIPRIETTVSRGNVKGHRWVTKILGFGLEGIMHNFYQGHDAGLYARIS